MDLFFCGGGGGVITKWDNVGVIYIHFRAFCLVNVQFWNILVDAKFHFFWGVKFLYFVGVNNRCWSEPTYQEILAVLRRKQSPNFRGLSV